MLKNFRLALNNLIEKAFTLIYYNNFKIPELLAEESAEFVPEINKKQYNCHFLEIMK